MARTKPQQHTGPAAVSIRTSAFLETIIAFLMPYFTGAAVDLHDALNEIIDTLASYGTRTRAEVLQAAQIIAFGMTTLDVLAEAKTAEMSQSMRIRHRGCANGLNRSTIQMEKSLDKSLACDLPTPAEPAPEPINDMTEVKARIEQVQTTLAAQRNQPPRRHPSRHHNPPGDPRRSEQAALGRRDDRRAEADGDRGSSCTRRVTSTPGIAGSAARSRSKTDALYPSELDVGNLDGGPGRNRTGIRGFAVRCITTLPPDPRAQERVYVRRTRPGQERSQGAPGRSVNRLLRAK
jgi:hypothetical protein